MSNQKLRNKDNDLLFEAILKLRNIDECYAFFEDICTITEIQSLSQRLMVAVMLSEGRTYSDIIEKTNISAATISRISKALNYGADGYKIVLDRLKEN